MIVQGQFFKQDNMRQYFTSHIIHAVDERDDNYDTMANDTQSDFAACINFQ